MKKRLLFWINLYMLHFTLAYYLQQKLDDDFYAIIDVPNNPKKMFLNQKLVEFQKTWYFHDHIKKTDSKPDLEYLSKFERKYQIDLWKLAINERHFYRFNRFYRFSTDEILRFLEQECKLFEQILDEVRPNYLLTYDPPFHHQKLLLDLCRAKGIKVLSIIIARFEGKSIIAEDGATFDLPRNLEIIQLKDSKDINQTNAQKDSGYNALTKKWTNDRNISITNKIKALSDYILFSDSKNAQTNFTYYGRSKNRVIIDSLSFYVKRQWRSHYLEKNLSKTVNLKIPFVYFPLSIDEELTLLHYAPFFTNQIEVIRHIAKSLPIDYRLYVKDHIHAVFRGWRDIGQYKEMSDIPNVTLIHPSYPSNDLVKNSKLVITIRGTASLDAAYENKPSIIFGDMAHDMLPSVYKVKALDDLPKLIRTALNTPVDPIYIKKYLKLISERVVDFNWWDYEIKRNNQFYSGNVLSDVEISENSVKEFFENNKEYFKPLVNAHLTRIVDN
ncbi:MAG: hypothetical protein QXN55_03065 [Candidatus Nitrosotenuis sp.]